MLASACIGRRMHAMADTVMVRLPGELAERIKALGHKREPFVRRAVEAALSGSPNGASPPPERAPEPSPAPRAREAAPPQASGPSVESVREAMAARKPERSEFASGAEWQAAVRAWKAAG